MAVEPDWTLATWEGNRRIQHREFQSLSFREKLRAIERLGEVTDFFSRRASIRAVKEPESVPAHRSGMTIRFVPLRSAEGGDSRVAGTVGERLALVGILSEDGWARTHRPLPTYTRATIPIVMKPLRATAPPGRYR